MEMYVVNAVSDCGKCAITLRQEVNVFENIGNFRISKE